MAIPQLNLCKDNGKMQLSGDGRCRLLFDVYPAFVEALPTISEPRAASEYGYPIRSADAQSRDNYITQLRDEIKNIGLTFKEEYALCELQNELSQEAGNMLDVILFCFQDLVYDRIAQAVPESLENEVCLRIALSYVHPRY